MAFIESFKMVQNGLLSVRYYLKIFVSTFTDVSQISLFILKIFVFTHQNDIRHIPNRTRKKYRKTTLVVFIISPMYNTATHSAKTNKSSRMFAMIHEMCSDDLRNPIILIS